MKSQLMTKMLPDLKESYKICIKLATQFENIADIEMQYAEDTAASCYWQYIDGYNIIHPDYKSKLEKRKDERIAELAQLYLDGKITVDDNFNITSINEK